MEKEKLILVCYLNCKGLTSQEFHEQARELRKVLNKNEYENYIIGIQEGETRLECINPVIITDEEQKQQLRDKLNKLNEEIDNFFEQQKNRE